MTLENPVPSLDNEILKDYNGYKQTAWKDLVQFLWELSAFTIKEKIKVRYEFLL